MHRRSPFVVAVALLCPLVAGCQPLVRAQGATTAVFPDVQTKPIRYVLSAADAQGAPSSLAPDGQEGYGRTVLEIAGTGEEDAAITVRLYSKLDGAQVGVLPGTAYTGGSTVIDLSALAERAGEGRFMAQLTASQSVGAIARSRWASGAGSAYEAPATGSALLLPILAVSTGSHSSVLAAQNAGNSGIQLSIQVSDPLTGETLMSNQVDLGGNQGVEWDTAVERFVFDPRQLRANVDGGFLGALRINSGGPVALVGYMDESAGPATAAIVARPVSAADGLQILPRVRSAADGGSLIGIANASALSVEVTVRFDALVGEAGAPAERQLTIPGNGAAYIDLSPGGRSLPAAPAVQPFLGSATITASGPILAAVLEDWRVDGIVESMAGYNAFGPRDLSLRWAIPVVRRATDFMSSLIVVHNPTAADAEATVQLADADGAPGVVIDIDVPAHSSNVVDLSPVSNFPIGSGSAIVDASAPVAVVAYEMRDASREYPLKPLETDLQDERNSMVEGVVMLTPVGPNVRVDIQLKPGVGATTTYNAFIMNAGCSEQDNPAAYPLEDVVAGRSSTTLANLDLRTIADGYYAIRLKRAGNGPFAGRVACTVVPEVRGVEVADNSAVRGIPLVPGPDTIPTVGPTQAATATSPPNRTPVATATNGVGPTRMPGVLGSSIYLPVAHASGTP